MVQLVLGTNPVVHIRQAFFRNVTLLVPVIHHIYKVNKFLSLIQILNLLAGSSPNNAQVIRSKVKGVKQTDLQSFGVICDIHSAQPLLFHRGQQRLRICPSVDGGIVNTGLLQNFLIYGQCPLLAKFLIGRYTIDTAIERHTGPQGLGDSVVEIRIVLQVRSKVNVSIHIYAVDEIAAAVPADIHLLIASQLEVQIALIPVPFADFNLNADFLYLRQIIDVIRDELLVASIVLQEPNTQQDGFFPLISLCCSHGIAGLLGLGALLRFFSRLAAAGSQ